MEVVDDEDEVFEDEVVVECELEVVVGAEAPPVSAFFAETSYRPFASKIKSNPTLIFSITYPSTNTTKNTKHTIRLTRIPHHHAPKRRERFTHRDGDVRKGSNILVP